MEQAVISRLVFHAQHRTTHLASAADWNLPLQWLREHYSSALAVWTTLDAQQESILLDENAKLKADEDAFLEVDQLLSSLIACLKQEGKYTSERVYLDVQLLSLPKDSDEALRYTDQSYALKKKQSNISNNVIDALKIALQDKLSAETQAMLEVAAFPTDDPRLLPDDMLTNIQAVLLNKAKQSSHFRLGDFIRIYLVQPWLSKQAVEDIRLEEDIAMKDIAVDTMESELTELVEKIRVTEE